MAKVTIKISYVMPCLSNAVGKGHQNPLFEGENAKGSNRSRIWEKVLSKEKKNFTLTKVVLKNIDG